MKQIVKILLFFELLFNVNSIFSQTSISYFFKTLAFSEYKQYDSALLYIDSAILQEPNNYVFILQRGKIKMKQNNFTSAIVDFKRAEKIKNYSATYFLAQSYSYLFKPDSALFYLQKYMRYYNKKLKPEIVLDTAFNNISKSAEWKDFWQKKHYSEAEIMLQDVQYDYKQFQVVEALVKVNEIIKTYKKYDEALFFKGVILYDGKNYKQAVRFFSKAIKYNAHKSDYYLYRGRAYARNKKYKKAIEDFSTCLKIDEYQPIVYLELAKVYQKAKKYSEAVEAISNYTKYFYKDYDAKFLEAQINFSAGNYLETIKICNKLVAYNFKEAKYYNLRGQAYLNAHSYQLAFDDFNTCLDINPQLTKSYYYRGLTEMQLKKMDAACADWHRAIKNKDYRANDYYYEYCKNFDRANF